MATKRFADAAAMAFLAGGGEMGAAIRAFDWSRTALGPFEKWPQSLRSPLSMILPSKAQICLFWGSEYVILYNDAYRPVFGAKHPHMLGQPGRVAWSEIWDTGANLHALCRGSPTIARVGPRHAKRRTGRPRRALLPTVSSTGSADGASDRGDLATHTAMHPVTLNKERPWCCGSSRSCSTSCGNQIVAAPQRRESCLDMKTHVCATDCSRCVADISSMVEHGVDSCKTTVPHGAELLVPLVCVLTHRIHEQQARDTT
jgi:hypothetical protein